VKLKQMLAMVEQKQELYARTADNLRELIKMGEGGDAKAPVKRAPKVARKKLQRRKKRTMSADARKAISVRMKELHAEKKRARTPVAEPPAEEMTAH
jgi:hypothetical protein